MADSIQVIPDRGVIAAGDVATSRDVLTRAILDGLPQMIPGVPNSAWVPIILGQVRGVVAALSGLGIGYSEWVSGNQLTLYVSLVVGLAALVWSGWQKVHQVISRYRASAASAAASAMATAGSALGTDPGVPVAVAIVNPKASTPALNPSPL